ncbi:hypothetical protein [Nocardia carnea]|uniref:hypothetical protein n=1 Tax=Nocardia carnea TaxID=37328 RepID=UPI0024580B0A|nr:hypothetical protein [Nocardia carnea]
MAERNGDRATKKYERFSDRDKKKYLKKVQRLVDEGVSLTSARQQVSDDHDGQPSAASLARWAREAQPANGVGDAAAASASETDQREPVNSGSRGGHTGVDTADYPATAESSSADPAPGGGESAGSKAEKVSEKQSFRSTDSAPASANGDGSAELVHVPSVDVEAAVDENRRLRQALQEADREIRALRDLLVVYASR